MYKAIGIALLLTIPTSIYATDGQSYGRNILDQMNSSSPVCAQYYSMIENITYSGSPDVVVVRQIDAIVDKAYKYGCFN